MIYLQISLGSLTRRIAKEGDSIEKNISEKYLEDIVEAFDYFFFNYQGAPLLVVKADDIDFGREEDVLDLLDQLRDMKKSSLYYVPQSYGGKGVKKGWITDMARTPRGAGLGPDGPLTEQGFTSIPRTRRDGEKGRTMADHAGEKITIPSLQARKAVGPKIVCLTAYDYPTARILDEAGVDLILVGDSLGMVVLGYENTVPVTMDEMIHHTRAVSRAVRRALVVGDMPYFSFHLERRGDHPQRLPLPQGGGRRRRSRWRGPRKKRLKLVEAMVDAEIPVMGHIGLTPQSVHHLGGYRVRGTAAEEARRIVEDAAGPGEGRRLRRRPRIHARRGRRGDHPGGQDPDDRHRRRARPATARSSSSTT